MFKMTSTTKLVPAIIALLSVTAVLASLPDYPLSRRELKVRSEYYTDGGKYLGGSPKFDEELEFYGCTDFNIELDDGNSTLITSCYNNEANATACIVWTANEVGTDEYETGTCVCEAIISASYCSAWTCAQTEISTTPTCTGDDEYRTCYYETEQENTRCACDTEDDTGTYCASWSCTETAADGLQEYEEYTCVTESYSAQYCETWTGIIEGPEETEASTCECLQEVSGRGVCSYWECQERGLTKCPHGGPSWCNFGVSVGVGGFFGSLGSAVVSWGLYSVKRTNPLSDRLNMAKIILGLLWMSGWSAGVVVWGGQDGAIYASIWWGVVILCGLLRRGYRDCSCKFNSNCGRTQHSEEVGVGGAKHSVSTPASATAGISSNKVRREFGEVLPVDNSRKAEQDSAEALLVEAEMPQLEVMTATAQMMTPPVSVGTHPAQVEDQPFYVDEGMPVFVEVPGET